MTNATSLTPKKVSQRIQLPGKFITEARAHCAALGLSLPDLLGLAAQRGLGPIVIALNPAAAPPLLMDDVEAARAEREGKGAKAKGERGAR